MSTNNYILEMHKNYKWNASCRIGKNQKEIFEPTHCTRQDGLKLMLNTGQFNLAKDHWTALWTDLISLSFSKNWQFSIKGHLKDCRVVFVQPLSKQPWRYWSALMVVDLSQMSTLNYQSPVLTRPQALNVICLTWKQNPLMYSLVTKRSRHLT